MKTLTTIAITALMTTVLGFTFYLNSTGNPKPIKPIPAISQIQMLSDLATLKVQLSDSMKGENNRWDVQWLLHGEAILGVDLSKAAYVSVANQAEPQPSCYLNHIWFLAKSITIVPWNW